MSYPTNKTEAKLTDVYEWNRDVYYNYPAKFIINPGSSSSGKTYAIMQLILEIMQDVPETATEHDRTATVVAESHTALLTGAITDTRSILQTFPFCDMYRKFNISPYHVLHLKNGARIEFRSFDEHSAHHGKRKLLFLNEASKIKWAIAMQLSMRSDRVFLDYNPSHYFWADRIYAGNPDAEWIYSTYRDNPYASPEKIAEIEALKVISPQHYRVYGLGKRGALSGQVFPNVTWVPEYPKYVSDEVYFIDPGWNQGRTAIGKLGKADGKLWGKELLYGRYLSNGDMVRHCNDLNIPKSTRFVCDPASPALIKDFKDAGYNMITIKKPAIVDRLRAAKNWQWCITADSLNWKKEQENYIYPDDGDGGVLDIPIDAFNDLWDGSGYAMIELCYGGALPHFI